MSYIIQEIQSYKNRIRGHERLAVAMAHHIDELHFELEDTKLMLAEAIKQREEARDLLKDLQRESVPA